MCKKSLLMMLLMALLVPWAANAQSVQVGDGTNTSGYLPSYSYYNYSVTQQIYTAEEINASGNITSIAFFNGGSTKARKLAIYMAHTDKSAFEPTEGSTSSSTDWIALTEADKVYEASEAQDITAGEWTTFTLDTPFAYNGTDNLVVGVLDLTGDWESGMSCRVFSTESKQAIYKYQDAGAYGIDGTYNGVTQTGTLPSFKNQIVLGGIQQAFPAPSNLTASDLYGHGATIDWTENGTATSWKVAYKVSTDEEFTEMTVNSKPYTFTGLDPETTYNVKVCAVSGSQQSNWSAVISFTTTVACPAPTELTAVLNPGDATTATLSWTSTATDWVLEYGTASDFTGATSMNVSTRPVANLTGLTPETTYYARVKAVCGGDDGESAWSTAISFEPTAKLVIGSGTSTSSNLPTTTCYNYSMSQQIYTAAELGEANAILSIDFYSTNGAAKARNFDLYMVSTDKTSFESTTDWIAVTADDLVYSATNYTWQIGWNSFELDVPFIYDGTSNVAIVMCDEIVTSYECSVSFRVFEATGQGIYARNDNNGAYDPSNPFSYTAYGVANVKDQIRLLKGVPPTCAKPTGLTVNYTGGTEATISWTSEATAWNMRVNGEDVNGVITNPYTLTGLELATTYEVEVQANCGNDGLSDWAGPVSFTTDLCMPENMCAITIELTDAYGDGGGQIQVVDVLTNDVLGTYTNSGESTTYTLNVCEGREINFIYTSTDSWPYENGWVIMDVNEDIISEHVGCSSSSACDAPENGIVATYTVNCTVSPCRTPSDFAVSEIGNHSVKLSWTENGPATEWVIEYMAENDEESTSITVNTNPYTLTGLTPETYYVAQVTPVCEVDKPSEVIDWTTDVACPAPQNIVVSDITATSALVSWLGYGESYDLRYVAMPTGKGMRSSTNNKPANTGLNCKSIYRNAGFVSLDNKPAKVSDFTGINHNRDGWYYYDNGTYTSAVGLGGGSFYWGIMIPAGTYVETTLTKTSVYDYMAMTGTVTIYNDGTDAPAGDALAQAEVTLTGSGEFVETSFGAVTIDPSKNLWIVYYNESGATYPAAYCSEQNDANGRWISTDGEEWFDIDEALSGTGDWMIRAYLEGEVELEWIEVNGITASEYLLTDLDPETTYIVQIRSNCGEDGQSTYAGSNFTTMSLCDTPYDLEATDINYNAATLNWTGAQESFNLRYRHATEVDPTAPAIIILEAHDTWGDGTGYQMLLDADATAYGVEIPESGPYTGSDYSAFEYLIPENADCDSNTENLVFDGSITLEIPAGVYDWCIINPEPGGNMWIAGNGTIPGRYNDYVFEPGVTYHFTMERYGTGDGATLEVIRPMSEWVTVENVTEPYELTGLTPETYYEWQVQGINADCDELEWTEISTFTTLEQTTVTQTIALSAGTNWVSFYVDITLADLKAALTSVLGTGNDVVITIKSQTQNAKFQRGRWTGQLSALDMACMYTITVPAACEIALEGMPVDASALSVTISSGANWIAFPFDQSMTPANFFGSFPVSNDVVKSQAKNSRYVNGRWVGQLSTLEPGKGYIYNSVDADVRIFTFPASK